MPLDSDMDSASSSSATLHESDLDYVSGNDERIRKLISSYNLSERRDRFLQDGEDEELRRFHTRLECLIYREPDSRRRQRLVRIVPFTNRFRELLLYLKKLRDFPNTVSASKYIERLYETLTAVIEQLFEDKYRIYADLLGMMDTLTEILICDVQMFGIQCQHQNCSIRRLIANALTNLSFSSLSRKRRICSYPNFIECIARMISGLQSVAQAYSGLIRNLAWNADPEIGQKLQCTVPILIQASLRAYEENDPKTLSTVLAAVWNLSYSPQNQLTICANRRFLEILIELLQNDPRQETIFEAASGVLKYASQSFSQNPNEYLRVNYSEKLTLQLIELLRCSSFTAINNCLYTLHNLLRHNGNLRAQVSSNRKALTILYHLCNSAVMDVKATVTAILGCLETRENGPTLIRSLEGSRAGAAMSMQPMAMTSSYSGGTIVPSCSYFDSSRLLKLRMAQQYTPDLFLAGDDVGKKNQPRSSATLGDRRSYSGFAPAPGTVQSKCCNLPVASHHVLEKKSSNLVEKRSLGKHETGYENRGFDHVEENNLFKTKSHSKLHSDVSDDDDDGIDFDDSDVEQSQTPSERLFDAEDSVRGRKNSLSQSLKSVSLDQTNILNCCASTPLSDDQTLKSASAVSDSRSDYTATAASVDFAELSVKDVQHISKSSSGRIFTGKKNQTGVALQSSTEDEGDYANFDSIAASDLLNRSIESVMPKRVGMSDEFLADMIEQAQPKPSNFQKKLVDDSVKIPTTIGSASSAPTAAAASLPSCEVLYLACV